MKHLFFMGAREVTMKEYCPKFMSGDASSKLNWEGGQPLIRCGKDCLLTGMPTVNPTAF
jgi:hypothetical protein